VQIGGTNGRRARVWVRDVAASGLERLGVTQPSRRLRERLTIFTFHRVLPREQRERYPFPGLAVTPDELSFCLGWVARRFTCGPLREVHARWGAGERPSRPFAALTFDDTPFDNYAHARPLLDTAGIRATFFAPVEPAETQEPLWHDRFGFAASRLCAAMGAVEVARQIGIDTLRCDDRALAAELTERAKQRSAAERHRWLTRLEAAVGPSVPAWARTMTVDELRTMHREGHEIGSHGLTHALLPSCDAHQLAHEVTESKRRLESLLDDEVSSFCYPNGDHDPRVVGTVAQAGYERAVTTRWGSNGRRAERHRLRRCDVSSEHLGDRFGRPSSARLALRLSGLQPNLR
jgi:peptidoglycan/xylan/chitin deacetylase (PgdA/CDA1 family)